MIIGLSVHKRTLGELRQGLEHASQSQQVFAALAEDKSTDVLPYSRDLAKQRYGLSLLRKGADQEAQQEKHESEHKARLDAARATRDAERAEREAVEAKRQEEIKGVRKNWQRREGEHEKWRKNGLRRWRRKAPTRTKRGRKATTVAAATDGGGDESARSRERARGTGSGRARGLRPAN